MGIIMENLKSLCVSVRGQIEDFCVENKLSTPEKLMVFGAVRGYINPIKLPGDKPEVVVPEKKEKEKEKEKKGKCKKTFDPDEKSFCMETCKKEDPDAYGKCLEKFKASVEDSARVVERKEREKDEWGFLLGGTPHKINMVLQKWVTKEQIAEKVGVDVQRVSLHLSKLKTTEMPLEKRKNSKGIQFKLNHIQEEEE